MRFCSRSTPFLILISFTLRRYYENLKTKKQPRPVRLTFQSSGSLTKYTLYLCSRFTTFSTDDIRLSYPYVIYQETLCSNEEDSSVQFSSRPPVVLIRPDQERIQQNTSCVVFTAVRRTAYIFLHILNSA